ncbi:DMT family transporter [Streptomyces sp. t39]|uniref:DMT family transporter n=1 Tax=Streptomyces sp. t39 TaxID=1828156 RepID=UPI0011CE23BC|nr:DMT family transporter [Streptomyces sp. t39]TXS55188.1 DMT family transporter [Streptomyces sp. t39]
MTTTAPGRVRLSAGGLPPGPGRGRGAGAGLLLAALATVVWSGSFVTSRALHDSVPPVQAAFWRWVVAIVAVAPFALRAAWRRRALIRAHLPYLLAASLLGVTVYNTLVNQAGLTTSAGNMGMIMAASPVLMALFARLGGARLGLRRTAGMLVACAGVLLLVGDGSAAFDPRPGDLWMFGAALSFAAYSALLRRRPAEIGGVVFLFTTFVLGALLLAPVFAASVVLQGGGFEPSTGTVGPLVYVGLCSSAVAFFAWNRAVAVIGAARAGAVYHLQPVCVAGLSYAVLGESLGGAQLLCMALILGGVALAAARDA